MGTSLNFTFNEILAVSAVLPLLIIYNTDCHSAYSMYVPQLHSRVLQIRAEIHHGLFLFGKALHLINHVWFFPTI